MNSLLRIYKKEDDKIYEGYIDKYDNILIMNEVYYYDNNGNTIAEQQKNYTTGNEQSDMSLSGRIGTSTAKIYKYDALNRLVQFNEGATEATYTYGADNLRNSKTVNNIRTDFVWNGQNLASETKNNITTTYTYDPTGIALSNDGTDTVRFIKDPHGNVIATSKNKNIVDSYDYTAFGVQLNSAETSNPFRYCGEYYDEELDSVYLRNRYYQPAVGRFINEDPIKDGLNWYNYCAGNPVMMIDPSGLGPVKILNYDSLTDFQKQNVTSAADAIYGGYINQKEHEDNLKLNGAIFNSAIPDYNPDIWNDDLCEKTNCYAYAFNMTYTADPKLPFTKRQGYSFAMQPREFATGNATHSTSNLEGTVVSNLLLEAEVKGDADKIGYTFIRADSVNEQPSGTWEVILVVKPNSKSDDGKSINSDYHWYRKDTNGNWSHKPGSTIVGSQISDPLEDAKERGYTVFVGRYYVGPQSDTTLLKQNS